MLLRNKESDGQQSKHDENKIKQHHLVISLTHLQEALSAVHNKHAKMQLNHFHIERFFIN